MGMFGPSTEEVVMAIVALASSGGISFDNIQSHEAWNRYADRWFKPKAEEVMDALRRLERRNLVRERSGRRWKPTL